MTPGFPASVLLVMLVGRAAWGIDAGNGFGEALRRWQPARQAGIGGLAIAGVPGPLNMVEMSTLVLEPGVRWYGIGGQAGAGSVRVGLEAFLLSAEADQTGENSDGSYGGMHGRVAFGEWGGRLAGRLTVPSPMAGSVEVVGRAAGWWARGGGRTPFDFEIGAIHTRPMSSSSGFSTWFLAGPLGRGTDRWQVTRGTAGAGIALFRPAGWSGREDAFFLGAEAQLVGDGLPHGGLGAMYRAGRPDRPGGTATVRGGVRFTSRSLQTIQPHAGLGYQWRLASGLGMQVDYAVVPFGALGTYHYATVTCVLPSASSPDLPKAAADSPPAAPHPVAPMTPPQVATPPAAAAPPVNPTALPAPVAPVKPPQAVSPPAPARAVAPAPVAIRRGPGGIRREVEMEFEVPAPPSSTTL